MRVYQAAASMVASALLAGCVAAPAPLPLVAFPAPGKSAQQFGQDDQACRANAAAPQAGGQVPAYAKYSAPGQNSAPVQGSAAVQTNSQAPVPAVTPEVSYLRCMAASGNIIQALAPPNRPAYAYYGPDPLYPGGDYAPFLYDGFGFYGVYGGFRGYGGGYGGYGGGFHGGEFRGGDFRGGGGFRGAR